MQFGQPVGCLFQPFGGRVGLTVEFLVGFGAVEPEVCGQIDYLLACVKERNSVFSGRSMRQGEKEKLGTLILAKFFDRRIRKGKLAPLSP